MKNTTHKLAKEILSLPNHSINRDEFSTLPRSVRKERLSSLLGCFRFSTEEMAEDITSAIERNQIDRIRADGGIDVSLSRKVETLAVSATIFDSNGELLLQTNRTIGGIVDDCLDRDQWSAAEMRQLIKELERAASRCRHSYNRLKGPADPKI